MAKIVQRIYFSPSSLLTLATTRRWLSFFTRQATTNHAAKEEGRGAKRSSFDNRSTQHQFKGSRARLSFYTVSKRESRTDFPRLAWSACLTLGKFYAERTIHANLTTTNLTGTENRHFSTSSPRVRRRLRTFPFALSIRMRVSGVEGGRTLWCGILFLPHHRSRPDSGSKMVISMRRLSANEASHKRTAQFKI